MVYIVYGGAGYIGSHLIASLLKTGNNVICIDNLSNSYSTIFDDMPNRDNLSLITDDEYVYTDFEKVDAIFHFAAFKSVEESIKNPLEYYENNIGITCRALEMMKNTNCDTFIYSGSASVYGFSPLFGSSETDTPNPLNPYGRTKLICENMIKDFSDLYPKKKFFSLRYFNPYGGNENPKKELFQNLIPSLLNSVKKNIPFEIYGNDYNTPDGTCVRDFIHITDLINGHISCLKYDKNGFHIFNLGNGVGITVQQVVEMFKVKHPSLIVKVSPRRIGDVPFVFANITKAKRELNWLPRIQMSPEFL